VYSEDTSTKVRGKTERDTEMREVMRGKNKCLWGSIKRGIRRCRHAAHPVAIKRPQTEREIKAIKLSKVK